MVTFASNRALGAETFFPISDDLFVNQMTIVDNGSVTLSYSTTPTGILLESLFSGTLLSVSLGTFTIDQNRFDGDGSIVLDGLPGDLEGSLFSGTDLTSVVLTFFDPPDLTTPTMIGGDITLNSGGTTVIAGDISAGGNLGISTTGTTNSGATITSAPVGLVAPPLSASDAPLASFDIELIGEDLFVEGERGTITEIRINGPDCQTCDSDNDADITTLPPLEIIISDISFDFGDVFQFLQSTDDIQAPDLQALLFSGNDRIEGSAGDDVIDGLNGDDTIGGGGGNDTLNAGDGADNFDGGDGFDVVSYASATGRVFVDTTNIATARGEAVGDFLTNIEGLIGGRFGDHLRGGTGEDLLRGGNASDRLFGRGGDDTINGERGADAIYGGGGADIMTGGAGRDRFIFFSERESGVGDGRRDIITDFSTDQGDRIEVSRFDADLTIGRAQAFEFIAGAEFSAAGQLRFDQSTGSTTIVQMDQDGDGLSDVEIELTGLVDLTASNFLL